MSLDKPLCIDLFCGLGLGQSQFLLGADSFVEEFVTGRAQNPNHVRLSVLNLAARTFALILWPVGKLNHARFSARLAGLRKIGIPSTQPDHYSRILELSATVVDLLNFRLLSVKRPALTLSSLLRAKVRAVPTIAGRRRNREVIPTNQAIRSTLSRSLMLATSNTTVATLAFR